MKKDDMVKFFKHINLRQSSHTIKHAFQFKAVLSSCKNGTICDMKYFNDPEQTMDNALPPASAALATASQLTLAYPV